MLKRFKFIDITAVFIFFVLIVYTGFISYVLGCVECVIIQQLYWSLFIVAIYWIIRFRPANTIIFSSGFILMVIGFIFYPINALAGELLMGVSLIFYLVGSLKMLFHK